MKTEETYVTVTADGRFWNNSISDVIQPAFFAGRGYEPHGWRIGPGHFTNSVPHRFASLEEAREVIAKRPPNGFTVEKIVYHEHRVEKKTTIITHRDPA